MNPKRRRRRRICRSSVCAASRSSLARLTLAFAIMAAITSARMALATDSGAEESVARPEVPVEAQEEQGQNSNAASEEQSADSATGNPRCRWGEHCPDGSMGATTTATSPAANTASPLTDHDNSSHVDTSAAAFLKPPSSRTASSSSSNGPPEGFVLTARVYTDPDDKMAHFDNDIHTTLPYWECGVAGSTTSPLMIKHAYFRHALSGSQPWSGTEYGPHPQLLIPLKPLELQLNSGEHQSFQPGAVILLEDVLSAGHKLKALKDDMAILLLTLPQHYHHVGKDRVSLLPATKRKGRDPCPNPSFPGDRNTMNGIVLFSSDTVRKTLFGTVGLGLSSLFAIFLGKVAPLWLSVGVGGICFVVGGTCATVACGEYVTQEMEIWYEKRRLKLEEEEGGGKLSHEMMMDSETVAGDRLQRVS